MKKIINVAVNIIFVLLILSSVALVLLRAVGITAYAVWSIHITRQQELKTDLEIEENHVSSYREYELPKEQARDDNGRWTKEESDLDSEELKALFNKAMEGRTQRPFNEVMAVALKKCEVPDVTTYYMYLKEALEQGIINKVTESDTNKQWIELTDEGMLPF